MASRVGCATQSATLAAVRLTVLPHDPGRADLTLRQVVLPRHVRVVQEAEDVVAVTTQSLGQVLSSVWSQVGACVSIVSTPRQAETASYDDLQGASR